MWDLKALVETRAQDLMREAEQQRMAKAATNRAAVRSADAEVVERFDKGERWSLLRSALRSLRLGVSVE